MEEKARAPHRLTVSNRNFVTVTGVADVLSFDLSEVLLETEQGMLMVKGEDLHVKGLSLEKGEVDLEGKVDSFTYSEVSSHHKQGESILGRLFK